VNTIAADFSCAGGKIKQFTLRQSAASGHADAARTARADRPVQADAARSGAEQNLAVTYQGAATAVAALQALPARSGLPQLSGLGLAAGAARCALVCNGAGQSEQGG
jgi:hypothetical protein